MSTSQPPILSALINAAASLKIAITKREKEQQQMVIEII
jgi:hypothetical protein